MIWTDKTFTPDPTLTVKLFDTPEGPYLISLKQLEIMQACRERNGRRKHIFATGPKWTSKTVGCCDAVVDHLWNVNHSSVCVIASSIGAGDDSGVWTKLMNETIPQWIKGDFGLDWWRGAGRFKPGAKQKGASKRLYAELINKHGGKSYVHLSSLKDERDVEKDFFNAYYSMIYWGELQLYKQSHTYETLKNALRKPEVSEEDHVLLCDGNPSDQGKRAWMYRKWFEFRIDPSILDDQKPEQESLRLIQVNLDDNPFLTPQRKAGIRSSYGDDPSCFARYVKGEWVEVSIDSLFIDVFSTAKHVVGDDSDDPEILIPSEGIVDLYNGWDFGLVNPAVVFCEQAFPVEWQERGSSTEGVREDLCQFRFFDERVYVDSEDLSLWDFVHIVLEARRFWEKVIGHTVNWIDVGDRSVHDTKCAESDRLQHAEILAASGGEIDIIGVDRGPGTVSAGIRLWRRLLFSGRLQFSREKTPQLIAAQTGLMKKRGPAGVIPYSIAKGNPHKHVFDSARYLTVKLCWQELLELINESRTKKKSEMGEARVVNVPL